jgi:hypothetical protein
VPDPYKWNLADIYLTNDAWRAAKEKIAADIPLLKQYQGKLGTSAETPGRRARPRLWHQQGAQSRLRLRQHAG